MNKAGFVGAVVIGLVASACAEPTLLPTVVAPDNAKSAGNATIGPNAHGGKINITIVKAEAGDQMMHADVAPICTGQGGKATPGPKWNDILSDVGKWTTARNNAHPGEHAELNASTTKNGAQASGALNGKDLVSGPMDGDVLNTLSALAIDCAADKPVMTVNGQPRPVDVLYASSRVTGADLNFTSAEARRTIMLTGWNAATSELTIIRAQDGFPIDADKAKNATYPTWNAVIFRNLEGFVPANAMPLAWRQLMGTLENDLVEIVFPMTGMAIKADALVIKAPVDTGASPSEMLNVTAIVKKAK